ncbi:hypothetical protein KHA93_11595 [Bacillus sp. FJAT-49732]|uniref:Uncharacterized protein n=1 Tax=Lederbergia citrisecunda TaxID=2833583 RepID=A0A942TQ91_9BACI|nr:hypothetical protein [Lederbergia citrisecunda]MBS4200274.1 hypothetical protein [Lederbergia citrisecunda]
MKQVYKINSEGFYIEPVIIDEDVEETPENCVELAPSDGMYRPKWTGTEWIEDMSQEEIEALKNAPKPLTEVEQLRIDQAQANAELFEMMLMFIGGMA